jgi:drug/metabolite transporter (DMT)-like permease
MNIIPLNIPPTYLFALTSGLAWSITTLVIKHYLLKSFDPMDIYILRMGVGFPLLVVLLLLFFSNVKSSTNTPEILLKKIKKYATAKMLFIFIISIIAGFFGLISFWKVLETNNGSYSVAFVWPLVVLFTTIISYFFFNEKISVPQFIGITLVILGIFMLNIKS